MSKLYRNINYTKSLSSLHQFVRKGLSKKTNLGCQFLLINVFKNSYEACAEQACITLRCFAQSDMQILQLTDNGPGFANIDNALQPLYTTKKQGNGLGLALCNDIVQKHNGQLQLANTADGAQITIKLPQNSC